MRILSSSVVMTSTKVSMPRGEKGDFLKFYTASMVSRNKDRAKETGSGNHDGSSGHSGFIRLGWNSVHSVPNNSISRSKKLVLLQQMIEKLTGKKVKLSDLKFSEKSLPAGGSGPFSGRKILMVNYPGDGKIFMSDLPQNRGETSGFVSQGLLQTQDGRQISFSVQMTRSTTAAPGQTGTSGSTSPVDPLVVNLMTPAVTLSDNKTLFDLDGDGKKEMVSFPTDGSGFLAVDLNHDGKINSGQELFGPKTGDGFKELAAYDEDQNHWIDENDSIFSNLRIFMRDQSGGDSILTLDSEGIGAIYLGDANTPWKLTNDKGETTGAVKETGIFVRENGTVGTVQDVDLMA